MNHKFCPAPWIFQAIRNNGDIRVCCQANSSKSKGIYKKQNGTAFNAKIDNLQESRNCKFVKELRLSMLNNIPHEACIRCDSEEANGLSSRRKYELNNWNDQFSIDDAKLITNTDGSIDVNACPVIYYDLRFGNTCNLKCRMCGPTDSNTWYNDYVELNGKAEYHDSHGLIKLVKNNKNNWVEETNSYNWMNTDIFWNQIKKNISNIQRIYFVGGEPLLISEHYDLLQECINSSVAGDIIIEYNTNLTVIPDKIWNMWSQFKRVELGISLDAAGKLNEYIRHPSNFDTITKNLHKLNNASGNYATWLTCTVQAYNIAYLPEFIKWILEEDLRVGTATKPIMTPHALRNPEMLNIKILPPEAKQWILKKYNSFYLWLDEFMIQEQFSNEKADQYRTYCKSMLGGYCSLMMSEDWSHLIPKFWDYTSKLDKLRHEKFKDVCPELYEYMAPYF